MLFKSDRTPAKAAGGEGSKSSRLLIGAGGLLLLLFVGYRVAQGRQTLDTYKFSHDAQQGQKVNPVPLNMQGKDPDLVYLGSYLVNVQLTCNDCHTCPSFKGLDPYKVGGSSLGAPPNLGSVNAANFLAGGTPVLGRGVAQGVTIAAPNLTPDASGLPGGLTYDEFKTAMQSGQVARKPGHILQVMPWPSYRNLYENDMNAVYQYLSAIPPAKPGTCSRTQQMGP